jgi:hypothetical protein
LPSSATPARHTLRHPRERKLCCSTWH